MSNQEEQQGGSQLLNIMKNHLEEDPDEEGPNKFSPNFLPINPENFNANINQEKSKPKQDTAQNFDEDKIISNFSKLNLGSNPLNLNISPKKIESNNYFQNPMMNKNMNNKNNQKDLAFNYYFGSGIQGSPTNKGGETGGQTVSSHILEHLGLNPNNDNNNNNNDININEQQFKNYFNNQANGDNQNEEEKIENNLYKLNPNQNQNNINNMNQNQQQKMMINMNFQNNNNNDLNFNENMIKQNKNMNN
jgi:hypothetical protein